jgi:hypothetical protein
MEEKYLTFFSDANSTKNLLSLFGVMPDKQAREEKMRNGHVRLRCRYIKKLAVFSQLFYNTLK